VSTCARCGRESPADASFCAGCGAPLEPRAAREERKVVTVLFADLVGSTARAEQLDPEDVRAILAPFYARVRAELERFGGTVEKFIMVAGDVVNTAARMQSAAPVNGILAGEQTFRATERMIDYREHEPVTGKGKSAPMRVWEAVQPRSAVGVDVRQHGRAPLVGRDDELDCSSARSGARRGTASRSSSRSSACPGSARAGCCSSSTSAST
jgi:class 3 adenylate cyclase